MGTTARVVAAHAQLASLMFHRMIQQMIKRKEATEGRLQGARARAPDGDATTSMRSLAATFAMWNVATRWDPPATKELSQPFRAEPAYPGDGRGGTPDRQTE